MPPSAQVPPLLSPISTDELGELQLYLPTLKVLSSRGPGETGGVPSSLEPIVKRLGTKIHWFALSGIPGQSDSNSSSFAYYNPQIPASTVEKHNKTATNYLWPLLHGIPQLAEFDSENWKGYRQLNEILASESLGVSAQSFPTLYWIHDYQLALVAPLMSMQAGIILSQFWHVPWPDPSVMVQSVVGKEIVEALLCNRVIGFHTTEYATNFLNTVMELMPNAVVDMLKMEVRRRQQVTKIVVMPLGVDFALWQRLAKSTRPMAEALSVKHRLASQVVLGVDRLDYTKGVLEKLHGIDQFLTTSPVWLRRFHYVQLAQPPQSPAPAFASYAKAVESKIDEINKKYASNGWQPIIYLPGHYDQKELASWYQAADVLAINSVRDGLNLIAKEYVASRQDEQGALMLSKNAGCAAELAQGALLVNPFDACEFATSLQQALTMEAEEKRRRMTAMRRIVGWNQLHDWALGFLRQSLNGKNAGYSQVNVLS